MSKGPDSRFLLVQPHFGTSVCPVSRKVGHSGQIGNAPNSAGKKIKFNVTTVFNAYLILV